mmetsp:Transcript_47004/g.109571  ORF Transcript_47004/g.109571 Transcript_47004/m.109571 type:complete len:206 (-) Transcript_47004:291-908(-)
MTHGRMNKPEFSLMDGGSADSTETHTGRDFWLLIKTIATHSFGASFAAVAAAYPITRYVKWTPAASVRQSARSAALASNILARTLEIISKTTKRMQQFCEIPNHFFCFLANSFRGATPRLKPMPTSSGIKVSHISSYSKSTGLMLTVVENTLDADQGIVNTPSTFVTDVRKMASETFPFADVIIVTPEDKVVGTTVNSAIPCKSS